jgi:hypothetical protein
MKNHEHDRIRQLLEHSLPPVGDGQHPARDLWPGMQRRLREPSAMIPDRLKIPWFDWVLAGGVAIVAVAFPASIPVLLYYL